MFVYKNHSALKLHCFPSTQNVTRKMNYKLPSQFYLLLSLIISSYLEGYYVSIDPVQEQYSPEKSSVSTKIKMLRIKEESLRQWKKKRSSTFMTYCFMYSLSGMQSAFQNTTIWIYVTR